MGKAVRSIYRLIDFPSVETRWGSQCRSMAGPNPANPAVIDDANHRTFCGDWIPGPPPHRPRHAVIPQSRPAPENGDGSRLAPAHQPRTSVAVPDEESPPALNRLLATAEAERPQERLQRFGPQALGDAELLAIDDFTAFLDRCCADLTDGDRRAAGARVGAGGQSDAQRAGAPE